MTNSTNVQTGSFEKRIAWSLLMIRAGIAVVFLMWTIDKFVNPGHAAAVFKKFYMIGSLSNVAAYAVGAVQMAIVLAFLAGLMRTWSYGIILILHSISTFSSWAQYLDPWTYPHLLFFAAIPMLAACVSLWMLRDLDHYSVDGWLKRKRLTKLSESQTPLSKRETIAPASTSTVGN